MSLLSRSVFTMGCLTVLAACATTTTSPSPETAAVTTQPQESIPMATTTPKQQVRDLLTAIETGASEPVGVINPTNYVQHNLSVADGLAGFGASLAQLPEGSARAKVARVFQDGDYVFAHTDYDFFGPKIGFDVFRFEDGKIVEHWDNLQETAGPNPSGRSMIDGPVEPTDLEKTDENKALARGFVTDVLVNAQYEKLTSYIGDTYIQHNPNIGDGLDGLQAGLAAMAEQGVTMEYDTLHVVLGEGSFVLTVSEGRFAGAPTAFYDLFRVEGGKIVEHWDTIEAIPERSEWKNDNGKFGF